MYLESFVSFSYFSWLNDLLWLLYMSLDIVHVIPINTTCSFSDDAVVLCTMQLERQLPFSGHLDGYLQLHVSLSASIMLFLLYYFCIMCLDDLQHDLCIRN